MYDKQFPNAHLRFESYFIIHANALQKKKKKIHDLVFESCIKMASQSVLLGSLTSRIKGDHAYRSGVEVGNRLFCRIETATSTAITEL